MSRGGWLADHLEVLARLSLGGLPIVAMIVIGGAGRSRAENLGRLLVLGAVGLALSVVTIPAAVTIQFRTVTPLYFAILALTFLSPAGRTYRALYPVAALAVFLPFWATNVENVRWYRAVTETYRDELIRVAPRLPSTYRGLIVLHGTARALQDRIEEETGLSARHTVPDLSMPDGEDLLWKPAALAGGFRTVAFCQGSTCPKRPCAARAYCVHGTTPDGYLLLSFASPREGAKPPPGHVREPGSGGAGPALAPP